MWEILTIKYAKRGWKSLITGLSITYKVFALLRFWKMDTVIVG